MFTYNLATSLPTGPKYQVFYGGSHPFGIIQNFCYRFGSFNFIHCIHKRFTYGNTLSIAVFIPFITQELSQGSEALYYGLNALSNNMILCDRKQLKNPNDLILGTPGSGKSFAAKREITNAFLITNDENSDMCRKHK